MLMMLWFMELRMFFPGLLVLMLAVALSLATSPEAKAFSRVGTLSLNTGEDNLRAAVVDTANGFAYFATFTSPSIIVKIRLSDFTRVASLTLNAGDGNVTSAVIDSAAGFAYFGTGTSS